MMQSEGTAKSRRDSVLMICSADGEMKPIGKIVEDTTSFDSGEESDSFPTMTSFSFSCELPALANWFEECVELEQLLKAQGMLEGLRDYHALWLELYGFGMRKERRKIVRNYKILAQRFNTHCRIYGITIKQKQQ